MGAYTSRYKIKSVTYEANASPLFYLYPRRRIAYWFQINRLRSQESPKRKNCIRRLKFHNKHACLGNYTYRVVQEVGAFLLTFLPTDSTSTFVWAFFFASEMFSLDALSLRYVAHQVQYVSMGIRILFIALCLILFGRSISPCDTFHLGRTRNLVWQTGEFNITCITNTGCNKPYSAPYVGFKGIKEICLFIMPVFR